MAVLVTGAAGFIGYHAVEALLRRGQQVIGLDNLNPYYDVRLKRARLDRLLTQPGFAFHHADIADRDAMAELIAAQPGISQVLHLAAQAGVRHSMRDPYAYVTANVMGHVTVLEAARGLNRLDHLVYASSSSVYGLNGKLPFAEDDPVDTPASLYAATKRSDELISHAYAHLYGMRLTGLRFFTVYGPWGRPDMAYYAFARAIMQGEPITLFDEGHLRRDFTYVNDAVAGILAALDHPAAPGRPALLNVGNDRSESVLHLVKCLEQALGRTALIRTEPRPPADVPETLADLGRLDRLTGPRRRTPLAEGIAAFGRWFLDFHGWRKIGVDGGGGCD